MSAFFAPQEAVDEEDEEQSVDLEEEVLEVIKDSSGECVPEHIMEQTFELAVSSGEAGSSGPGVNDTISVAATAVVKSVAGARLPGTAKVQCCDSRNRLLLQQSQSLLVLVKRGLQIAKCSAVAVAKSVGNGEARPPGFAQYRATTRSERPESSGEFPDEVGASWSRAIGTSGTQQQQSQSLLMKFGFVGSQRTRCRKMTRRQKLTASGGTFQRRLEYRNDTNRLRTVQFVDVILIECRERKRPSPETSAWQMLHHDAFVSEHSKNKCSGLLVPCPATLKFNSETLLVSVCCSAEWFAPVSQP